jgi:4-aminobutyrate aminotransferase-like enzyme
MSKSRVLTTSLVTDDDLPAVVGARGVRFVLSDGREVIDATNSPAALGHQHPRIVKAIRDAASGAPVIDEGWSWENRSGAADDLLDIAFAEDRDWFGAARFVLSGSEANDLALSLCQALTGRQPLVTRERAYHGMVGLARDVTVQPQWHGGFSDAASGIRPVPAAAEVRTLPFPEGSLSDGLSLSAARAHECLAPAGAMLDGAAAVIVDYSQGGRYPAPAYQDELARMARERGILWIADEVVTGFGKQGRWFNFQRGSERPDIVTCGKAFGGGMVAAAAIVLSNRVLEMIGDASWRNYSAMRAQPITVAAIRAFIRAIEEEELVERVASLQPRMEAGMRELLESHPSLGRVDGCGFHWTLEFEGYDWRSWSGDAAERPLADEVVRAVLDAGVLIATSGEGGSLLLSLPLVIEESDIDLVFEALDRGLAAADRALAAAQTAER